MNCVLRELEECLKQGITEMSEKEQSESKEAGVEEMPAGTGERSATPNGESSTGASDEIQEHKFLDPVTICMTGTVTFGTGETIGSSVSHSWTHDTTFEVVEPR
ncbi:hypothetical protein CBR_g55780 [Chara braunii]|uniref:Uncharacterized protein n=1 Tax=Chara braunii TaxID=69332 RepID=A0A388MD69_CHABU|nr:hypothetical protein CBR_g55780 [Chara braunii]|eukprot:GBG92507.1 hypothetical protein CBR_g55780 [Chara braunii]